jgi:hypothetical protein
MKKVRQLTSGSKPASAQQAAAVKAISPTAKDWTVKVAIRLPHKIGQPLGSSSGDGGCN